MNNEVRKVGAGIYINGSQLEIDVPEMLRAMGIEDTEANRDMCMEVAQEALRESGLMTPDAKTIYTHMHSCPRCSKPWRHDGKRKKCGLPKAAHCPRHNS